MITSLTFANPAPLHARLVVETPRTSLLISNATIVTSMKCTFCTKTHCSCRGDAA